MEFGVSSVAVNYRLGRALKPLLAYVVDESQSRALELSQFLLLLVRR